MLYPKMKWTKKAFVELCILNIFLSKYSILNIWFLIFQYLLALFVELKVTNPFQIKLNKNYLFISL